MRPVRWEAEIFGFRTVSLDIRQNTTVTNRVLQEIWHKMNPVAKVIPFPEGWQSGMDRLDHGRTQQAAGLPAHFFGVSEEARELLDLLYLIRETLDGPRSCNPSAPSFSPMTRSAADVLGLYLLAKYCGLFRDDTSSESCRLRIVPLFETIDDLRAGPAIMKELLATGVVKIRKRQRRPPGNYAGLFRQQQGRRLLLRQF